MIVLYVILGVIALVLLVALVSGKELNIEHTVTINKSKDEVFDYIKHLKNQDNFSVWALMDPNMKKTYTGTDAQVGFVSAWDSNHKNVGAGEQEIKEIVPGESVTYELRFLRPMQDVAKAKMWVADAGSNQTNVSWGFYSTMKFPMNAMKPIMKGMLMKSLTNGLSNLKGVLEK